MDVCLHFFVAMDVQRDNPANIYTCMALMAFSHQRAGFAEQKFFLLREIKLRKELLSALMALPALCCRPSSLIHLLSVSAVLLKSP